MNLFDTLPRAAESDREHLFAVADFFLALSDMTRHEGIFALDRYCYDKDDLKTGPDGAPSLPQITPPETDVFYPLIRLVVDGVESETVRDIARYLLASSDEAGGTRLSLMIGAEAICAIQIGESDRIICARIAAMMGRTLGTEYQERMDKVFASRERNRQ